MTSQDQTSSMEGGKTPKVPPLAEGLLVVYGYQGRESQFWGWGAGSLSVHAFVDASTLTCIWMTLLECRHKGRHEWRGTSVAALRKLERGSEGCE